MSKYPPHHLLSKAINVFSGRRMRPGFTPMKKKTKQKKTKQNCSFEPKFLDRFGGQKFQQHGQPNRPTGTQHSFTIGIPNRSPFRLYSAVVSALTNSNCVY
jgi:hypothetical protein